LPFTTIADAAGLLAEAGLLGAVGGAEESNNVKVIRSSARP